MPIDGNFLVSSLPSDQLIKCIDENPSFRGYFQGYVAEEKLRALLESTPGVSNVKKIPDSHKKRGDFSFLYTGKEYTVELKSLASANIKEDPLSAGIVGEVVLKKPGTTTDSHGNATTCIRRGGFDILAISLVAIKGEWDFAFILNQYLPSSSLGPDYLLSRLPINVKDTPFLRGDILTVLADIS